jgi:hypothetical protein
MSYSTKGKKRFVNCTLSRPVYVYGRYGKVVRVQPLFYSEDWR